MNHSKTNTCLVPWTHMYFHNNKKVYPCCKLVDIQKYEVGSTSDDVESLWNSSVMKDLRKHGLANTIPKECYNNCYDNANPIHNHLSEAYSSKQLNFFDRTSSDGRFDLNFVTWNINESNICNFKCTYCNIGYSNQFAPHKTTHSFDTIDDMLSVFEKHINSIERLYLSSGEPYLQSGYYKMLDLLIKHNKLDIEINVHTNLSGYMFGKRNFYELLNKFSNVILFASLDASEARAEYIRSGTNWDVIIKNREALFHYPNIKFAIQSVITNISMWSLPDFHKDWVDKGYIEKKDIRYFSLTSPKELHISVLPLRMKDKIKDKYIEYLNYLEPETSVLYNMQTLRSKVTDIISFMEKDPVVSLQMFNFYILKNDLHKKVKFKQAFPEFDM